MHITSTVQMYSCASGGLLCTSASGVAKAGPGWARARPKFVAYMCARALVLLVQWLGIQQVPGQYQ